MRTSLALLALAALAPLPAAAQPVNETLKLTAEDPAANADFGGSVAVEGSIAIIGAPRDDDAGISAGSAYLYSTTTGQQLFKIAASDAATQDRFGNAIAISGTTAIIGAPGNDNGGISTGAAYIFDTTTGQQISKLTSPDSQDRGSFGRSVDISGTTAIVGALGTNSEDFAAIFDTATGQQTFKLVPTDIGELKKSFGTSVAVSGTIAIVGAPLDDDRGQNAGAVYVFDATTGKQLLKLLPIGLADGDYFGSSVALSGNIAIVGAPLDNDAGKNSGSAYLFDTNTGQLLHKLNASDGQELDNFGSFVALDGNTAVVGAHQNDSPHRNAGSAYIFNITTGLELLKLTASDGQINDNFGTVAIAESTVVVGAVRNDHAGLSNPGSAYVFDLTALDICPSDLDNSGATDLPDLNLVLANFGMTTSTGDTNNDGVVDLADLNAVLGSFGAPCL